MSAIVSAFRLTTASNAIVMKCEEKRKVNELMSRRFFAFLQAPKDVVATGCHHGRAAGYKILRQFFTPKGGNLVFMELLLTVFAQSPV